MQIKQNVKSTKKFVRKHRVAIAVASTSIAWMYIGVKRADKWNEFLVENGLFDQFYAPNAIE